MSTAYHTPVIELDYLLGLADKYADAYAAAQPFPHVVIDDFLPESLAQGIHEQFPAVDAPAFAPRTIGTVQVGKFGSLTAKRFAHAPALIQNALLWLNSYAMLYFLERLTGIENLLVDPYFKGGGLHQIVNGGKLDVHADFNFEPSLKLYRRINLLLYFNKEWQPTYGGNLELWDEGLTAPQHSIAPIFNRCVVFTTSSTSFHGHPVPLSVPEGVTRKSLAVYYYTAEAGDGFTGTHETLWKRTRKEGGA
jgi:Rps23 Pro-64 3,4-dihydroxylase Tpa1-like proline 4-hydroxylase